MFNMGGVFLHFEELLIKWLQDSEGCDKNSDDKTQRFYFPCNSVFCVIVKTSYPCCEADSESKDL